MEVLDGPAIGTLLEGACRSARVTMAEVCVLQRMEVLIRTISRLSQRGLLLCLASTNLSRTISGRRISIALFGNGGIAVTKSYVTCPIRLSHLSKVPLSEAVVRLAFGAAIYGLLLHGEMRSIL